MLVYLSNDNLYVAGLIVGVTYKAGVLALQRLRGPVSAGHP